MQDRIPVNPGRVLISPENGAAYYATMTRADNATQEGTPLNKNSLLKDATAALFGLGADAVPDDVLVSLFNIGNWYTWEKIKTIKDCGYTSTKKYTSASADCAISYENSYTSIRYGDTFEEVAHGGGTRGSFGQQSDYNVLRGKYFVTGHGNSTGNVSTTDVYYADPNATIVKFSGNYSYAIYPLTQYVGTWSKIETTHYGYVSSTDPNAYPINDGYDYAGPWLLGSGKVVAGSYVGTGTYGEGNKSSLTFDFVPKIVLFYGTGGDVLSTSSSGFPLIMLWGTTYCAGTSNTTTSFSYFAYYGNTMSWYSESAAGQFNTSGSTFRYVAIG